MLHQILGNIVIFSSFENDMQKLLVIRGHDAVIALVSALFSVSAFIIKLIVCNCFVFREDTRFDICPKAVLTQSCMLVFSQLLIFDPVVTLYRIHSAVGVCTLYYVRLSWLSDHLIEKELTTSLTVCSLRMSNCHLSFRFRFKDR